MSIGRLIENYQKSELWLSLSSFAVVSNLVVLVSIKKLVAEMQPCIGMANDDDLSKQFILKFKDMKTGRIILA